MKIWITGCAGFLGARLARSLSSCGHCVTGLSRRSSPTAVKSIIIDLASDVVYNNLKEYGSDNGYPDAVIHVASQQPYGRITANNFVKSNILATANLIDALEEFPPKLLIYTSTLNVYGRPDRIPVREIDAIRGSSTYAITKYCSEKLLENFQNNSKIIILRLPSLYGAGQADSFIDGLARLASSNETIELFGQGEVIRDTLYVDDVVRAILSCISKSPTKAFSCMNLGCGKKITSLMYAKELVDALGSNSKINIVNKSSSQQFNFYADISEASSEIGFRPTPLGESMKRYANEINQWKK